MTFLFSPWSGRQSINHNQIEDGVHKHPPTQWLYIQNKMGILAYRNAFMKWDLVTALTAGGWKMFSGMASIELNTALATKLVLAAA